MRALHRAKLSITFLLLVEFNFTLKWVDDGQYGSKNKETGEWNGMLGEILENVFSSDNVGE